MTDETALLRIGELGRRVGLTEHVLRAWERRYGVLRPERTAGGYRLYSVADEERVRRMQAALASGLSTAEAARKATEELPPATGSQPVALDEGRARLASALDAFDGASAHAVLDDLLAGHETEAVLAAAVLPLLHDLGRRWAGGEIDVSQEHFASSLVRGRLATLQTEPAEPLGVAVLACPPGELHDLPLLVLAVALSRLRWRAVLLGADTPVLDLATAVSRTRPDAVVLGATTAEHFTDIGAALRRLGRATTVLLGGEGATAAVAEEAGATALACDPVAAASQLAHGALLDRTSRTPLPSAPTEG